MEYPIIFLDFETTGTNTKEARIVEIAMIKYKDADSPPEVKRTLVNPLVLIPKEASDCHGITDEMVKEAPTFKRLAKSLHEFISGCDLAGYNSIFFDIPLLYAEFERAGINWDFTGINFIDACTVFKRKEERTLGAAVKFYLGEEHEEAHGAEADVSATVRVLLAQQEKYPDLPKTNKELALYSNYDKPIYDLAGCFTKNETGAWVLNFGKNKGKLASENSNYLEWMVKPENGFMPDTIRIAKSLLLWKKK